MIFDTPRSTEVQDPKIAANIQKFISMGKEIFNESAICLYI